MVDIDCDLIALSLDRPRSLVHANTAIGDTKELHFNCETPIMMSVTELFHLDACYKQLTGTKPRALDTGVTLSVHLTYLSEL